MKPKNWDKLSLEAKAAWLEQEKLKEDLAKKTTPLEFSPSWPHSTDRKKLSGEWLGDRIREENRIVNQEVESSLREINDDFEQE